MKIDEVCGKVFLKEQEKLFPKPVAESLAEAMEFLEEIMAQVFSSEKELKKYIEDEGIDLEGDITDELEVFKLPDGRFLYVEA